MLLVVDSMTVPDIIVSTSVVILIALVSVIYYDIKGDIKDIKTWREDFLKEYNKDKADAVEKNNEVGSKILNEITEIKIGAATLANDIKYKTK